MQQAVGAPSNLDLVDACVNAETVNFELFKEVARLNQEAAWIQQLVSQQQQQANKMRSVCHNSACSCARVGRGSATISCMVHQSGIV